MSSFSTRLKKKIKAKFKKFRTKNKASSNASNRTSSSSTKPDSAVSKINVDPKKLTPSNRENALQDLNRDIEKARNLPPTEASKVLRASYVMRQALLNLGPKKRGTKENNELDEKEETLNATDQTKVHDDLTDLQKQDKGKNKAPAVSSRPISTVGALKKKPADMTAGEVSEAISEVEKAIEDGKALLPSDASLLQRVLYALKMALFELVDVDPKLAVKGKKKLEELIRAKTDDATPAPTTKAKVMKAIQNVNQVHSEITSLNLASQDKQDSEFPGLAVLKQKKPEELSTDELTAAIEDIDHSIENCKVLLPANTSKLLRSLYALKMALFELDRVDPKLRYEIQDHLKTILEERLASRNV